MWEQASDLSPTGDTLSSEAPCPGHRREPGKDGSPEWSMGTQCVGAPARSEELPGQGLWACTACSPGSVLRCEPVRGVWRALSCSMETRAPPGAGHRFRK